MQPQPFPLPLTHYENFPVASWLCPPQLRPPIAAIYHFARTADDIADEGDASPDERLQQLENYRSCLHAAFQGRIGERSAWASVFLPLQAQIAQCHLPMQPLEDLLSAFAQDVRKTATGQGYATRVELLDYCRRSANPIGRLLLHLYRINDAQSLVQSDAICTALQLINFWQDLRQDIPRGRWYVTEQDCAEHHVTREMQLQALETGNHSPALTTLVQSNVEWARTLMAQGMELPLHIPGRAGLELRLVVQGGLQILRKIERAGFQSYRYRPKLGKVDFAAITLRALRMSRPMPHPSS